MLSCRSDFCQFVYSWEIEFRDASICDLSKPKELKILGYLMCLNYLCLFPKLLTICRRHVNQMLLVHVWNNIHAGVQNQAKARQSRQ